MGVRQEKAGTIFPSEYRRKGKRKENKGKFIRHSFTLSSIKHFVRSVAILYENFTTYFLVIALFSGTCLAKQNDQHQMDSGPLVGNHAWNTTKDNDASLTCTLWGNKKLLGCMCKICMWELSALG